MKRLTNKQKNEISEAKDAAFTMGLVTGLVAGSILQMFIVFLVTHC